MGMNENQPVDEHENPSSCSDCERTHSPVSRRALMRKGGALAAASLLLPTLMRKARGAAHPDEEKMLVVFLRGGADFMNMCVPYGEDAYHAARPQLRVGRPDETGCKVNALDLDGFFGMHPFMAPLMPIYQAGDLAFVHAVGSTDETRSHFSAMNLMQRGRQALGDGSGWLARHLRSRDNENDSALRAVTTSPLVPPFLNGARTTAVHDVAEIGLEANTERAADLRPLLEVMYNDVEDGLQQEANDTFEALDALANLGDGGGSGAGYLESKLGKSFETVARLFKEDVGTEVACIDVYGWDTHAVQGLDEGIQPGLITDLCTNLAAFHGDLGNVWEHTTVVVLSEFGRRLRENGAVGTDHGKGNALMLLGGRVIGGQVYADWPGLEDVDLVGPGDMAVTLDYRDVLAEILRKRMLNDRMDLVFPGHVVREVGLLE